MTPREAVRALERCGWLFDRAKGSHQVFRHPDHRHRVVVPAGKTDFSLGAIYVGTAVVIACDDALTASPQQTSTLRISLPKALSNPPAETQ